MLSMDHRYGGFSRFRRICLVAAAFCSMARPGAVADLPIHATIKDIKGSWTFFLTPPVTGAISTCGSGAPNRNTDNLQPAIADSQAFLKAHGGVSSTLELQLDDDLVPFSDIRDTSGNTHRGNWKTLAVKDVKTSGVVGGWTTVYDEGFEVVLRDRTRLMALMKYTKNETCPEARDGDLEDRNGRTVCYTTDASKTQLGWYTTTAEDGTVKSGCFYAEKTNPSSEAVASSFVFVRQRTSEGKEHAVDSSDSRLSYYLSKEFVDRQNEKLNTTWKAAYESSFIQTHRTVLPSLIKDFGFTKVNFVGERHIMYLIVNGTYKQCLVIHTSKNAHDLVIAGGWLCATGGFEAMPSFIQGETANNTGVKASSQLYACPCKAGEDIQDTRSEDKYSTAVLSPVSMLQSTTSTVDVKEHKQETVPAPDVSASVLQANGLPKAFAWPNPFTDASFQEHGINQGGCGSCYAIAAVYALERRIDIAASKLLGREVSAFGGNQKGQPSFLEKSSHALSPQSVVSCSFYNQGCHGGFPYLVGKHATDMGVVEDGCMPYTAMDDAACPALQTTSNNGNAADLSSAAFLMAAADAESCHAGDRRWFAKDYGYVGGCYECGQCSGEQQIMAEIYANGPVTAAFDAPASLFAYSSGVYDVDNEAHARVCDNPGAAGTPNGLNGWEFTNHAVNIVGWGETEATGSSPAQKYWIIRNTWGPAWGQGGYFLLARGKNLGGIESQVSYIDPDFSRGMGRSFIERLGGSSAQTTNAA